MNTRLDVTLVLTDTVLKNLRLLIEDGSNLMYESELKKIEKSLLSIKEFMVGAGKVEATSHEQRRFIENSKDVIYDVDDLVDEFICSRKMNHTLFNKLLNCIYPGALRKIKEIQKKCRYVADDFKKFGFHCNDIMPPRIKQQRRHETYSHVYSPTIIGRDRDVKAILDMLLSYDYDSRYIGSLSIVGMGGVGKTTLAQLVYHSRQVAETFELRIWVCIGDDFDFKAIIAQILESATCQTGENQTLAHNVNQVSACLRGKRFLLVLDDVWSENVHDWGNLRGVLMAGGNGSRILATTRSRKTANIIADTAGLVYELQGLSELDSWHLFKLTTFNQVQEPDSELVDIGKNIVARCANHPLALKVVGTILYGQHRHKWLAVRESMMDNSLNNSPDLMSILKLSYDQLPTPLKCCFTYCALFPKGFKIPKDVLISLWMAQGYIPQPPTPGQTIEDVADTYFTVLLERCFLQDVERNECGDVVSCRIHDLMHDLAQCLAGEEIWVVNSSANISSKALHVFHNDIYDIYHTVGVFGKRRIRTYLQSGLHAWFPVATLTTNCKSLRALALHVVDGRSLPDSIGELMHLRYLDLSRNKRLEMLPRSLTKLCYLETLDLRDCSNLEELPSDLSKLMFLRCLDILGCELLTRMPSNMNKLTRLCTLTLFVVDEGDSGGKLEDLKALHNLKGCIEILIPANYTIAEENEIQGECLREMALLKAVSLHFRGSGDENRDSILLGKLQPHQNLKSLTLKGYQGSAVYWVAFVKHLVKLELISCEGLIHLSFLSNLVFLESLILRNLVNLEYMEDASSIRASPGSNELAFFPSLKYLSISGMCKLQRWWGNVDLLDGDLVDSFRKRQLSFMSLSLVNIQSCPELASFPACLNVEKLCLTELNTALSIYDLCPDWHLCLTELKVDHVGYLKPPSHERGQISPQLRKLYIGGLFQRSSHVTSEESLRGRSIKWDSEDDRPWKLIHESLQELVLDSLEKMVNLPKGMQHLTALQHLYITHCNNLKVIPEWISCLTSLETLHIISCTGLKLLPDSMRKLTSLRHLEIQGHTYLQKRCQPIHGEDWPKIQHIPSISFQEIS